MGKHCNIIGAISGAYNKDRGFSADELRSIALSEPEIGIYPESINLAEGILIFVARACVGKRFVVAGGKEDLTQFTGILHESDEYIIKVCTLDVENYRLIRKLLPFMNPVSHKDKAVSLGLGDRLGKASPGHIRLLKGSGYFPVLAQQSIRELNLTGRNYDEVLSDAAWAVLQEGMKDGWGADGDHLKTPQEVKMALDCGYTMITLDCSEHIDNSASGLSGRELDEKYALVPEKERAELEKLYLNKNIRLKSGTSFEFGEADFKKETLVYLKAIKFTIQVYNEIIKNYGREIDFEMSIDETLTSTTPEAHYFVAAELIRGGVEIRSLAPRFCGEFQKGIDYRGDIAQFEKEFGLHTEIADNFGYKISVHSGSDKFSIFSIVGRKTGMRFHLKTAGTNWLEAVRVIALHNAPLFRKIYRFAVQNLNEAKKYYHIFTETGMVPDVDNYSDAELNELLNIDESRQALHVTYGLLLQAKDSSGSFIFKDEFFKTLEENEEEYYRLLQQHIGRHVKTLKGE